AQAVSELLSPEAVTRTHQAAHEALAALLERGRADGSFRTDVPAAWLATASIALIHACSDSVRAGTIDPGEAARILRGSVRELFTGIPDRWPRGPAGRPYGSRLRLRGQGPYPGDEQVDAEAVVEFRVAAGHRLGRFHQARELIGRQQGHPHPVRALLLGDLG